MPLSIFFWDKPLDFLKDHNNMLEIKKNVVQILILILRDEFSTISKQGITNNNEKICLTGFITSLYI